MTIPLALVTIHFIADFLLQTDWMAVNKSKDWRALLAHTGVYSVCFLPFYGVGFALVTFVLHTLTDAITSRVTSRLWFFKREDGIWAQAEYTQPKHGRTLVNPWSPIEGVRHWFFVVIGADQLIHYGCLAWTLKLVSHWSFLNGSVLP